MNSKLSSKLSCCVFSIMLLAACQTADGPKRMNHLALTQFDHASLTKQAEANLKQQIIMCALPYLSKKNILKINIAYRYNSSSVIYDSNHADLIQVLKNCASPESGPKVRFSGNIEIWSDKKHQNNVN